MTPSQTFSNTLMATRCAEEHVFLLKAIDLFPKKPSLKSFIVSTLQNSAAGLSG